MKHVLGILALVVGLAPVVARAQQSGNAAAMIAELGLIEAERPVRELPGWRTPEKIILGARIAGVAELQALAPGVTFVSPNAPAAELADADAIIGSCSQELLLKARQVRWIQSTRAGVEDCMATPAVLERRLLLTNMQRTEGSVVAEHAIALALALARNLDGHFASQQRGQWRGNSESMRTLKDRTLLVVGLGGIGTEVAKRGAALGMKVVATRNSGRDGPPFVSYVGQAHELLALAKDADVIVSAAPLTAATTGLFDAGFFAVLKSSAYFINISRGRTVVTSALVAALNERRLAGAGLDVTEPEPLPPDHPLWHAPNVIITPHVASSADPPTDTQAAVARENLRRYVQGERMLSVVGLNRGY